MFAALRRGKYSAQFCMVTPCKRLSSNKGGCCIAGAVRVESSSAQMALLTGLEWIMTLRIRAEGVMVLRVASIIGQSLTWDAARRTTVRFGNSDRSISGLSPWDG
jgi:hypothetical protein